MRKIKNLRDVVDWGMCIGCGACAAICEHNAIELRNIEHIGIRPSFKNDECLKCDTCLAFCPGYAVYGRTTKEKIKKDPNFLLIGAAKQIWEGYASDEQIRYNASSGGAVTSLALYCLEQENMEFVVHTGMDEKEPWKNTSKISKTRADLISNCGSRYQTSSPCEYIDKIKNSTGQCVFIGRPCDVAAVAQMCKQYPEIDKKIGLLLTFFCAGTPSTRGTLELMKLMQVERTNVASLLYRGKGWPGGFNISSKKSVDNKFMPYTESWGFLQKFRPFRCQLCPDALGEAADISCGDAWHKYKENDDNIGESLILARNDYGKTIVENAIKSGYLTAIKSSSDTVLKAQGVTERRQVLFGRLVAMAVLMIPVTRFYDFQLFKSWLMVSFVLKFKSIVGTLRRLLQRGLWHKQKIQ